MKQQNYLNKYLIVESGAMRKNLFVTAFMIISFFVACNKEVSDNNFVTYPGNPLNDTAWVSNLTTSAAVHRLSDSTAPSFFAYNIDATKADTIQIDNNLEIIFPANAFVSASGGTINGKVKIEIIKLDSKGSFITSVKSSATAGSLLESEGALCIKVLQNGLTLNLSPTAFYTIRYAPKNNEVKTNMQLYYGVESTPYITNGIDQNFTWALANNNAAQLNFYAKQITGAADQKGYEIKTNSFRWISIARPLDPTLSKGKLSIILPLNFTNKNTLCFALLNDHNTIIQLKGDFNSRTFAASNIPTTKKLKVISVSLIDNSYYYSETEINAMGNTPAFWAKPEKKSLAYILSVLKKL